MILEGSSLIRVLGIPFGARLILIMVDEYIPAQLRVLCYDSLVARHGDVDIAPLVVSGLDQESLVSSYSQSAGQRTATGTATDDDILIFLCLALLERSGRSQRREE